MNIPLLRQIQAQIIQHPDTFEMRDWDCGTAACIAGWAIRLTHKASNQCGYYRPAMNALDLNGNQGELLFYRKNWPREFCVPDVSRLLGGSTEKAYAKAAVARIDHFIATEGKE